MEQYPSVRHTNWVLPDVFQYLDAKEAGFLVDELVTVFRDDTASRLEILRIAAAASDMPRILAEIHSIKGSARQLGAEALAAACQDLESNNQNMKASQLLDRIDQLQQLFVAACDAMNSYANTR